MRHEIKQGCLKRLNLQAAFSYRLLTRRGAQLA